MMKFQASNQINIFRGYSYKNYVRVMNFVKSHIFFARILIEQSLVIKGLTFVITPWRYY